jgi:hypothetical protein
MGDMLRRLVWFFIVSGAISYVLFLAIGSAINAEAIGKTRVVVIRDSLKPGVHYLAGMVMVHSNCAELSVTSAQLSPDTYQLKFSTWDEPSLSSCIEEDTPRAFRSVVFAPSAGVNFVATLNDEPIVIVVTPVVAGTQ